MKAPLTQTTHQPSILLLCAVLAALTHVFFISTQDTATSTTPTATSSSGSCPIGLLSGSSTPSPTPSGTDTTSDTTSNGPVLSRVDQLTCVQYATSEVTPDGQKLIKRNATNKNNVAFAPYLASQRGNVSPTLRGNAHVRIPSGGTLFPSNPDLASAVDALAATIQATGKSTQKSASLGTTTDISYFVPLFRKIQFMVLNDLYIYLTALYSTFNMTHADDEPSYLAQEPQQALNKKSLIVGHLLNVIQGQMYYICSTQQPLMPKQLGLKGGALLIQQDASVDPTFLLKDFSQPLFSGDLTPGNPNYANQQQAHATFTKTQSDYLTALKQTINFFTQYTNYLTKPDPTSKIPGANAFASIATQIANVIATDPYHVGVAKIQAMPSTQVNVSGSDKLTNSTSVTSANVAQQATTKKIAAIRSLRQATPPINPPFFYYDADTLRALKVVPRVASELPTNSTSIGWPTQLVTAAQQNTQARSRGGGQAGEGQSLGFSVAYFLDAQQERTTDPTKAVQLFINLPTDNGPYAQEIKKQPDWLNSAAGIINILRACLGDYSQLIGLNIVSSCTEQILCKALGVSCSGQASQADCQQELTLVNQVQQQYMQNLNATTTGDTTNTSSTTGSTATGAPTPSTTGDTGTTGTTTYDPASSLTGSGYLSGGTGT